MSLDPEIIALSMITRSPDLQGSNDWQVQLRDSIRDPAELLTLLELPPEGYSPAAGREFPFRVPRAFAARMRVGDAHDPLLRQVLPDRLETFDVAGFGADPVGELSLTDGTNLLQKYAGRALLVMTGACAINCRYCFRRTFPYAGNIGVRALAGGIDTIRADSSVSEVILSGGDPLILTDEALSRVFSELAGIAHIRRVRIHSRLPIVLPARLNNALLRELTTQRYPIVLVVHANHPRELDDETVGALRHYRDAGMTILNQAVLLRGINDDAGILAQLSESLFEAGVLPYYLHQLDRVSGAAHFEVSLDRTQALQRELQARLPGYLVPRFVREVAGEASKQPL